MSDPQRVALKVAGLAVLVVALALGLAMTPAGCGDEDSETETTGNVVTTETAGSSTTGGPGVSDPALVGKWHSETLGETWEFTTGGTLTVTTEGGEDLVYSYATEAGDIVLTLEATAGSSPLPYSISGVTLTVEDPEMGSIAFSRTQ